MIDQGKRRDFKVSIIVPIYNTGSYLSQCIDSLLSQTYKQIEIILVDDGSTDNSGVICNAYLQKDTRIQVLHQCNQGRVKARKKGLECASGEYVLFVDSDDWIQSDMCEVMLGLALKYGLDLVTSGYIFDKYGIPERVVDMFPEGLYALKKQMDEVRLNALLYKGMDKLGVLFSMCTKLYRRSLAMEIMELIPETMRRGEDYVFNSLYLLRCRSVYVSKGTYYHYRYYEGSTVTSPCPDFIQQIGMSHVVLQKALAESNFPEEIRGELLKRLNMRILLNFIRLWNDEKGQSVHIPYYCFDYGKIGEGRIMLYGAGKVGVDYYIQMMKTAPERLALWVDQDANKHHSKEYPVMPVEVISKVNFDKILIAVQSEELAFEIQEELIQKFQIHEDRILWQPPKCYWI